MAPRRSSRKSAHGASQDSASITASVPEIDSSLIDIRNSKKRTRSTRAVIPDSSDEDDTVNLKAQEQTKRRVLKSVSIPTVDPSNTAVARGLSAKATMLHAKRGSTRGPASVEGSDYETPGTSMSTTPAVSIHCGKLSAFGGLDNSMKTTLRSSTTLKRTGNMALGPDSEGSLVNLDAELAMQMQLDNDEAMQSEDDTALRDMMPVRKRQTMEDEDEEMSSINNLFSNPPRNKAKFFGNSFYGLENESEDEDEIDGMMPTRKRQKVEDEDFDLSSMFSKHKTKSYTGKGKGKAKVDDTEDDAESDADSLLKELSSPPTLTKGKGRAKAVTSSKKGDRPSRSNAQKRIELSEEEMDFSDGEESDGEEFRSLDADDADSLVDDLGESGSEEEPLTTRKPRPKYKSTIVEIKAKLARQHKFMHITDKWERRRAMNRDRAETQHPKLLTMWKELKKVPVLETRKAEQPKSINRKLKPFQLEGLSWMMRQEKTHYKGGLLGDEMGMGKTIQAVSLIMSDYPAKQPTLVCVPPVALMQWSNEIREYTDNKLKVVVYHGTNAKCKKMTIKELKSYDVIMVSYNSLESLYRKETKGWSRGEDIIKQASPLHAIHYHRLILDEAHSIKSRTTGVAKACFALKGTYKWCLSGTPVQNRIGEFFSLLRFLEVRPFADYFCRSCKCEKIHWEVDDNHMCVSCNHGASEHISVFNQELLNPITGDNLELREEALTNLHLITARIMLRRMKRDHTNSMELPMKDIIIHNEFFSEIERDFSSSIMTNTARKFDTYVAQGVMLNNYANIFGLIMQMRQVANHPDLLLKKNAAEGSGSVYVCNVCDEPAEDAVRSHCRHEFCRACIKDFMATCEASGSEADCPRCHIPLSIDFEQPELQQDEDSVKKTSIINRIKMENWTSSTKIEMLVYDLYKLRSKKQTLKSIVFSQFTSMLQLIEWRLRRAGFNTVMLDGSMTPAQRQKSIDYFMTNPNVEVFLVSLKAGGVALNLTEASRVFIVDPWWNPAAEWQSADRCHRIGQKRPCVITRLCIEDSVESRMVALQEKKAAMIAGTVNNDKVALDRLSPEDLQFLFRGS